MNIKQYFSKPENKDKIVNNYQKTCGEIAKRIGIWTSLIPGYWESQYTLLVQQ